MLKEMDFQSPSKWRFHCNHEGDTSVTFAIGDFQSPSKWRFHCNVEGYNAMLKEMDFQSPSKWRFHCNKHMVKNIS